MKKLYIYRTAEDLCVTHDGYIQLGAMSHSLERHVALNPDVNWIEVHWLPDVFMNRYKRASFQAHERASDGKTSIQDRPRDFPQEKASQEVCYNSDNPTKETT